MNNLYQYSFLFRRWASSDSVKAETLVTLRLFMFNSWLTRQYINCDSTSRHKGSSVLSEILIFWMPLFVLLMLYWRYAAFQSLAISVGHLMLFFICLSISLIYRVKMLTGANVPLKAIVVYVTTARIGKGYLALFAISSLSYLYIFAVFLGLLTSTNLLFPAVIPSLHITNVTASSQTHKSIGAVNSVKLSEGSGETHMKQQLEYQEFEACEKGNYEKLDLSARSFLFIELKNTELCNVNFEGSDFSFASISNSQIDGLLNDTDFFKSRIESTFFSSASEFMNATFNNVAISNSFFNNANFNSANFNDSQILSTQFFESNFFKTQVTDTTFTYSQLTGADFRFSTIQKSHFIRSQLHSADLSRNNWQWGTITVDENSLQDCLIDKNTVMKKGLFLFLSRCQRVGNEVLIKNGNESFIETIIAANDRQQREDLDLSDLNISQVPPALLDLGYLKSLNLMGNNLRTIEANLILKHLNNLGELDLSSNEISQPEIFTSKHKALKKLKLSNNNLMSFRIPFDSNIYRLDLASNKLISFSDFNGLSKLDTLNFK